MRRILCAGFGVALVCVACVLHFNGSTAEIDGLRAVGNEEGATILGGGSTQGFAIRNTGTFYCGYAANGCTAAPGIATSGTGPNVVTATATCVAAGGTCVGNITTNYQFVE